MCSVVGDQDFRDLVLFVHAQFDDLDVPIRMENQCHMCVKAYTSCVYIFSSTLRFQMLGELQRFIC